MSLLGKIGSALDPGGIAKDAINSILPKEAEILGDLAGVAIDLAGRNPLGAAKHALEALRDLPQAAHAVKDLVGGVMGESTRSISGQSRCWRGTPPFEPSPPNRGPQVNVTVNGGQVSITINETAHRWPRLQAAIDSVWHGSVHGPAHSAWLGGATPASPAPAFTGTPATCGAAPAAASASSAPVGALADRSTQWLK